MTGISLAEERDIENQTALLWLCDHPKTGVDTFSGGMYTARGIPPINWENTLRRLERAGVLDVNYWSRGWYTRKLYSVSKKTPEQKVIEALEVLGASEKYLIRHKTGLMRDTFDRALLSLLKKGWVREVNTDRTGHWQSTYELIELPF